MWARQTFAWHGVELRELPQFDCNRCGEAYDLELFRCSAQQVPPVGPVPDWPAGHPILLTATFDPGGGPGIFEDDALFHIWAPEEMDFEIRALCAPCLDEGTHDWEYNLVYSEEDVVQRQAKRLQRCRQVLA
jgi:hypothetical protein